MRPDGRRGHREPMPHFVIHHSHTADECGVVFSSFKGYTSPLRQLPTPVSCRSGGHDIWWCVDAADTRQALAMLPPYVADRATATPVEPVQIP